MRLSEVPSKPNSRNTSAISGMTSARSWSVRMARRSRDLQSQFRQTGMVVRPPSERPMEFALALHDRQIVDAGEAALHQPVRIEFPVLVAIGPIPMTAVVVPLIGKAHCDPIVGEGPDFLDQ